VVYPLSRKKYKFPVRATCLQHLAGRLFYL
jgi:hypothetical protein